MKIEPPPVFILSPAMEQVMRDISFPLKPRIPVRPRLPAESAIVDTQTKPCTDDRCVHPLRRHHHDSMRPKPGACTVPGCECRCFR